jgi:hypothetical protein
MGLSQVVAEDVVAEVEAWLVVMSVSSDAVGATVWAGLGKKRAFFASNWRSIARFLQN